MLITGINGFLIVFVCLGILSCRGTSKFAEEKMLIEMEKTPCYGACPVYTIKINISGNGLFNGIENTEPIGSYSFTLSKNELSMLKSSFAEIHFFDMEDRYFSYVTDLPTTYITFRDEGRVKKIMDYYGAPQELMDLEKKLASMVLAKKMKKIR